MRTLRSPSAKERVETHRIRGVTFSSRRAPADSTMHRLSAVAPSHVALVPFAFQRGVRSTELRFNPQARWFSESDDGIRSLTEEIHGRGMRVILKPHIWVGRSDEDGLWRADIGFESDDDWATWEAGYRAYILHHANLAQSIGADMLVVGTELRRSALERESFWRSLIDEVRSVYSGELTYAANWWEEYEDVGFWDALDYVGVQAYFPVGSSDSASVSELRQGWLPHVEQLEQVAERAGRPILFTEIGYRSYTGATERPWEWPSREQTRSGSPDFAVQENLYEAFFGSVWDQKWFAGAVLWRWHTDEEALRPSERIGFTPQHKPAEQVIQRWFGQEGRH